MLGGRDGRSVVGHPHIDHAARRQHRQRPDVIGMHAAQPAAFDHGRPAHADAAALSGDDHLAAAQQRGVAGEAAPCDHAHQRHLAREGGQAREGGAVQAGNDARVDITRAPAAAFSEQHHGQFLAQRQLQQAVTLLVVEGTLCAGQHGVVVGHHRHGGSRRAVYGGIDRAGAGDQAVGRGLALQLARAAAAALGGHGEATVFGEAAGVEQLRQVFARGAPALGVARGHGLGPCAVSQQLAARQQCGERRAGRLDCGRRRCDRRRQRHMSVSHPGLQPQQLIALRHHVTHGDEDLAHHAGTGCQHGHFHLHRLQQRQHLARLHRVAELHLHGDDDTLHVRACHRVMAAQSAPASASASKPRLRSSGVTVGARPRKDANAAPGSNELPLE